MISHCYSSSRRKRTGLSFLLVSADIGSVTSSTFSVPRQCVNRPIILPRVEPIRGRVRDPTHTIHKGSHPAFMIAGQVILGNANIFVASATLRNILMHTDVGCCFFWLERRPFFQLRPSAEDGRSNMRATCRSVCSSPAEAQRSLCGPQDCSTSQPCW